MKSVPVVIAGDGVLLMRGSVPNHGARALAAEPARLDAWHAGR